MIWQKTVLNTGFANPNMNFHPALVSGSPEIFKSYYSVIALHLPLL